MSDVGGQFDAPLPFPGKDDRRRRFDDALNALRSGRNGQDAGEAGAVPDLTDSILSRVATKRRFVDDRTRRIRRAVRAGVVFAGTLLIAAGVYVGVKRPWSDEPRLGVIDNVYSGVSEDAQRSIRAVEIIGRKVFFVEGTPLAAGVPGARAVRVEVRLMGSDGMQPSPEDAERLAQAVRDVNRVLPMPIVPAVRTEPVDPVMQELLGPGGPEIPR